LDANPAKQKETCCILFRSDRFLTLFFFHPLIKRRICSQVKIPILMYHAIASVKLAHRHPYYETSTSPSLFGKQMELLRKKGYEIVGIEKALELKSSHPCKMAVITFDDGFYDFFEQAFPVLEMNGFSATVFLPVGLMGKEFAGRPIMTWDHARTLSRKGIWFGSHSITHRKLTEMTLSDAEYEIRQSKKILESSLGTSINTFAYPYAFPEQDKRFLKRYRNMLEISGYRAGVTTKIGTAVPQDDRFSLKRLPINDFDDLRFFEAKLEGAYDWLHSAQNLAKTLKHWTAGRLKSM
jgi:peptidoglycan/xylan/chitin deacetylase (PgdA/CDA1 family)